jgi:hypothetical protein
MLNLYELVALRKDVEAKHLKAGDVGMVVHCYEDKNGYEIEFGNAEGETVAVLTMTEADVQKLTAKQILHVRDFAA